MRPDDAINKGFGRARGEILAWLKSDDTYEPGAIRQAVATSATTRGGLVYGRHPFIDENGRVIGHPARQTDTAPAPRYCTFRNSGLLRTALWNKVGPLDPRFTLPWITICGALGGQRRWSINPACGLTSPARRCQTVAADDRCWPECCGCTIARAARGCPDRLQVLCSPPGGPVDQLAAPAHVRTLSELSGVLPAGAMPPPDCAGKETNPQESHQPNCQAAVPDGDRCNQVVQQPRSPAYAGANPQVRP